jgi:D-alanyl-D-alanine carboxypeptidase (penicillin-binding protein 5/6)
VVAGLLAVAIGLSLGLASLGGPNAATSGTNGPSGLLSGNGSGAGTRLASGTGPAIPTLRSELAAVSFPGHVALPFPKTGESAVFVPGIGMVGASPDERPRPMASVTKIMTALLVLRDHPLSGDEGGPVFTMTEQDHLAWISDSENDDSNVMVKKGERIDERQLLEALLIPSADNAANFLATWDAGSLAAFVAKMNAEAKLLGLTGTHYADASGVSPGSVSTARDQAILGGTAMANPTLASIVDNASVVLPVAGRVWNYNPAINVDGIVGVKSGFTQAAQACLVTAAWRHVGSRKVLVVSATLDQPLGLYEAGQVDEALLEATSAALTTRTVLGHYGVVGEARAGWDGRSSDLSLQAGSITIVGWPGLVLEPSIVPIRLTRRPRAFAAGSAIATLDLADATGIVAAAELVLDRTLPAAPSGWRP